MKLSGTNVGNVGNGVAPRAGAWIETASVSSDV